VPAWSTTLLKKLIAPVFRNWHRGTIAEQRARQERMTRFEALPQGISSEPLKISALGAEWVRPRDPAGTILYLHGGAYALGSIHTHRMLAASLAKNTGAQVLLIGYRRAPEAPFPAGLEDAVNATLWLLEEGIPPREIMIVGDSAGGGLALAALLSLRDDGHPLPAGGVLLCPWTDLTLSGASMRKKAKQDFILDEAHLAKFARLYAGEHDLSHPLISPLYADLQGLPPLLIQVGTDEILLDDARRTATAAEAAGVDVRLEVYDGMIHVFHMFPFFPETRLALSSIASFVKEHLRSQQ
jgi:acetyl esterase/lipase